MGESRGRKAKKTKWHLQVGIKELIFTGFGVVGLALMSFALGTLAGRGDIYRVLHNWGLLGPDSGKALQVWHQGPPPSTPVATLSSPPLQNPAPATAKPAPPQATAAGRPPTSSPVKGVIAALPTPPVKKKSLKQEVKAKENNLEKMRREVASKLKFQNSLDLAATRRGKPEKESQKNNDKEPAAAPKAPTSQVVVAKFRDAKRAQIRLSQMRKQGEKVVLKEGKDKDGRYFAIYRQVTAGPSKPNHVAQTQLKKSKNGIKPNKSPAQ